MNDERCDRDRVTAILTLADELAVMPPDHPERCYVELRFRTEARACLLEALDTIDRLEGENDPSHIRRVAQGELWSALKAERRRVADGWFWHEDELADVLRSFDLNSDETWQALNPTDQANRETPGV